MENLVDGEYLSKEMSVSSSGELDKFADVKESLSKSHYKQTTQCSHEGDLIPLALYCRCKKCGVVYEVKTWPNR